MGKIDTVTKKYLSKNTIFADAFNFYVYNGEQVIKAEELKEMDTTEIILPYGENLSEPVQKFRDVLKYWNCKKDEEAIYMILGIEEQSKIHYAMPVKNCLYDALNYARQVERAKKSYKKNKTAMSAEEFLSGFRKTDKLVPVITLVVYFGAEEWDAPCSLHEMFSIKNEKLLTFVSDYKINLISPSEISDLEFEKFKTGLGSAMQFIKHQKDKNLSWMKDYKRFEKVDFETVNLINVVTGSKIKVEKTEEEVNMCYAFENSMREAKELGIEIGKAEGENKFAKLINFLLKDKRNAEVMEVTENEEKRQELYKFYGISD